MVEKQPRYHVDLHGLSLDECEAKIREMIDAAQEEWLADYEIAMIDIGGDPANHAALERLRAGACTAARSGHHENAQHGDARWENFAVMLFVLSKLTNCRRALSQAYP
jgi:hypothetical protein